MNFFCANFSTYWWFQTKQFTRLLEFTKLYKQNPLVNLFSLFTKTILWLCVWTILAIANTKKIPGCYVSRCCVGSYGGNIVSGARAGVTGEACTYVYLYWFTFIIVRPAWWQPRKNDPLDYWSQLNVNWELGNDVSAKIKPRKCGTGTCTICGNHAR